MPAAGLKLPIHRDDLTAHGSDKLFLFVLQRGAPAQGLHQRGLLGHGMAQPRRVQLDDAAGELRAPGRFIHREVEGGIHDIAHGVGQLLRVHPEPDRVNAGIPLPQAQAAVLSLRDRVDTLYHGFFQQEHRGGVLGSIGGQLIQPGYAFHRDPVQPDGEVALQRRGIQHRTLPGRPIVHPAAEGRQILRPHREARRHGMAAKTEKQVGTGGDALVQVEALHAAAAALALTVLIN